MHPSDDARHLNGQVRHGNYGVAGAPSRSSRYPSRLACPGWILVIFSCQHVRFFDLSLL
jgi:hypothetical protein